VKPKVFVAGHRGLVGSALVYRLEQEDVEVLTMDRINLDLRSQEEVGRYFSVEKPDFVFLAAAKVGGIKANNEKRAEFLYDNLIIQANIIHAAFRHEVQKLMFFGSSCIYPRLCKQPMKEEYLLTGPLEYTNEPYAIAKIAGLKLVENYNKQYGTNFISVMPTNLYGPGDNFDVDTGHVLPSMIRKFHNAKQFDEDVVLWGDGSARREFLHSYDLADACVNIMKKVNAGDYPGDLINIGCGQDISIAELANMIKEVVGFKGEIKWDISKPNGTPRKLQDVTRQTEIGWEPSISLRSGLVSLYSWYQIVTEPLISIDDSDDEIGIIDDDDLLLDMDIFDDKLDN
jgi:GDP-L-fucose synthase